MRRNVQKWEVSPDDGRRSVPELLMLKIGFWLC